MLNDELSNFFAIFDSEFFFNFFSSDYEFYNIKNAGYFVFVDAEHAFDSSLAEAIGVNTENFVVVVDSVRCFWFHFSSMMECELINMAGSC